MSSGIGTIKELKNADIHKICTGQVILSLSGAVKELIENAVDAQATSIEIRLEDRGCSVAEVSDDGSGIEECNFKHLATPHATSKISNYNEVGDLTSFGFRGEALSALAAVGHLEISTRVATLEHGFKLTFDTNGELLTKVPCSRSPGTTVKVGKLFEPLLVRRKELLRNAKREYLKTITTVTSYAVIGNIRVSCSVVDGGNKSVVLRSSGSSLRDNISAIWGHSTLKNMIRFRQEPPSEDVCGEFGIRFDDSITERCSNEFKITGMISGGEQGRGRSTSDRQFIYINSRPCDYSRVCKVANEVYKLFNRPQYPVLILDIIVEAGGADVNLTPDKRKILVRDEKLLLATLKSSLMKTYTDSIRDLSSVASSSQASCSRALLNASLSQTSSHQTQQSSQAKLSGFLRSASSCKQPPASHDHSEETTLPSNSSGDTQLSAMKHNERENQIRSVPIDYSSEASVSQVSSSLKITYSSPSTDDSRGPEKRKLPADCQISSRQSTAVKFQHLLSDQVNCSQPSTSATTTGSSRCKLPPITLRTTDGTTIQRPCAQLPFSWERLKSIMRKTPEKSHDPGSQINLWHLKGNADSGVHELNGKDQASDSSSKSFTAKISSSQNEVAEMELQRHVTKDTFNRMEVLGQFNLGFIIVRHKDDLFIIDQHASDEKFNFERLQRDVEVASQPLILRKDLNLSSLQEQVVVDNMSIFKTNGFAFIIDESKDPGHRVMLTAVPTSSRWTFDKQDIEELIDKLSTLPGVLHRPAKLKSMFASRACRSSIMIGTALNQSQMLKVVRNLATLDQPWNCPHGRPTMRHLFNLAMYNEK